MPCRYRASYDHPSLCAASSTFSAAFAHEHLAANCCSGNPTKAVNVVQIAASTDVTVVSVDDVDKDMLERERQIELQKPDLQSKPENIRCD